MKRYLGDSVYVELRDGQLHLYTDNGFGADQSIYLEGETIENLIEYYSDLKSNAVEAAEKMAATEA